MSFPAFETCVSGMSCQSRALAVVSGNIANATTNGYKETDARFATLLGGAGAYAPETAVAAAQRDLGGARVALYSDVGEQGVIAATGEDLDVAVSGRGMLVFAPGRDGAGGLIYGRDGSLQLAAGAPITAPGPDGAPVAIGQEAFLVDKNGYFAQGWPVDDAGVATGALGPLRVDAAAFPALLRPTAEASLAMNLPANAAAGEAERASLSVYDAAGERWDLEMTFVKTAPNVWSATFAGRSDEIVTATPADALSFGADGALLAPATIEVAAVDGAGAAVGQFALDLSGVTQLGGPGMVYGFRQDGYPASALQSYGFDGDGYLVGGFGDGLSRPLYRLALAQFANVDGLTPLDGNVYAESAASGAATLLAPGEGGAGSIAPQSVERSTVDLAEQFSRMLVTQNAYNSAATAFRTNDEMTEIVRDLKS